MKIDKPKNTGPQADACILRPWRTEDAAALQRQADNIRVWNNLDDCFPHPYTLADAHAFIALAQGRPTVQEFAIEVDGQVAGGIAFTPGGDVDRLSAEVGCWLGEQYWGRGIATQAMRALTKYVFAHTGMIRLWAVVYDYNRASQRMVEKAGFTHLTTLHRAAIKNDRIIDLEYYELLKPCI